MNPCENQHAAMNIERLLQINTALLATLGTLLLGMGQGDAVLPVMTASSAAVSLYITDIKNWFQFNRILANAMALAAVTFAFFDFFSKADDSQLLAIANLLTYLQIVLLYQKKSNRVYWQLIVLSLLQVVVSAALNLGVEFGILLIIYMFAALSAMALFFIHREVSPFESGGEEPVVEDRPSQPLATFGVSLRRWPLAQQSTMFTSCASDDPARAMLSGRFVRQILALGFSTILFTAVLFFMVPRFGEAHWRRAFPGTTTVGFSQEIALKRRNDVQQNEAMVMRVALTDNYTGDPYRLVDEPYFRGCVLVDYSVRRGVGHWKPPSRPVGEVSANQRLLNFAPQQEGVVRQEIVLEPNRWQTLFALYPVHRTRGTPFDVRMEYPQRQLLRDVSIRTQQYRYELTTTGLVHGSQPPLQPLEHAPTDDEKKAMLEFDLAKMPVLAEEAGEVTAADAIQGDHYMLARALERHLQTNPKYEYDLDRNSRTTEEIDPIEDFVANHSRGHCEFFASTLCMMLRSQGVPARVVNGYHGGEYNAVGGYYQVRQMHAHSWVEAYLAPDEIPSDLLIDGQIAPQGAWLRLDSTPSSDGSLNRAARWKLLARMGDVAEYAQVLWSDYILGLDSERQQSSIYAPLAEGISRAFHNLFSLKAWRRWFSILGDKLGVTDWATFVERWFNWRAGLAASIVSLLGVIVYRLVRRPVARVFDQWTRRVRFLDQRRPVRVDFYSHLQRVLARHGLHRSIGQTPRQWAASVGTQLRPIPGGAVAADGIEEVVEAYYHVRFGQAQLDEEQISRIDQMLLAIEHTVRSLAPAGTKRRA